MRKALLVEDSPTVKRQAIGAMVRAGFMVDWAENGAIAVEKCRYGDYDLIIMDIFMPVMNGDEATKAIRALGGSNAEVPILCSTIADRDEDILRIKEAGIDGFLDKPFSIADLRQALRALEEGGGEE